MASSVKNKIRAGSAFLFLLVMISGGVSLYFIIKFRIESGNVLQANYQSIEYAHKMQQHLDSIQKGNKTFVDSFRTILDKQESNITESGEAGVTAALRNSFNKIGNGDSTAVSQADIGLQRITTLNLNAIKSKTKKSEQAADEAMTLLITIVSIIFIIGLTFVINFPSIITTSIQKLTAAIKEIGEKNYSHRIHIESKDEFGDLADSFNEMAERLEHFENSNLNQIIFEKSRAEAVINSLKDASIGIDKNDIVLFANDQALQLLGIAAGDIVGIAVNEISKRNDLLRFLVAEKGNTPFKIVVDDRENYFIKETIDISQDGASSKVIVLKNITSFKELDVAKNNFIATISHELKTPLASSDLGLKLLGDERIGNLSGEQKELIQNLKQDNKRMLRILSELLNMSQVEAGKIVLDIANVDPYSIADSAIEAGLTSAREKNIRVEKNYTPGIIGVKADAEKTGWVINNFLVNAIKHAPAESRIMVNIRETDNHIEFSVADSGPGIADEYLLKVFDRFFKVPGSKAGGTGLGLAISKEFIEAEGGTVWVKSEIGSGSEFGFRLPKVF